MADSTQELRKLPALNAEEVNSLSLTISENSGIIDENLSQAEIKGEQIKQFLSENISLIVSNQNDISKTLGDLMERVIDNNEIANDIKAQVEIYQKNVSKSVPEFLKEIDNDISEVSKAHQIAQNVLDGTTGLMSKMTGLFKSSEEKVKEALNPITRTVDSIEQTFKEKEEGLDNNYLIIKDKLPKYGEKIYKLEAMANALSIINEKVTHPETKTIITQRVSNYSKIAIDYREGLSRMLVLLKQTGNAKNMLITTHAGFMSLIDILTTEGLLGNPIEKVQELHDKGDRIIAKHRNANNERLGNIMKNDLESKQKVLTDMQAGIARMKDLKTKVESYDLENNKISTDIENYKPQLEEARRQIDEEIKKVAEGQANSSSITKIILNSMSKESSESLEKVNKLGNEIDSIK